MARFALLLMLGWMPGRVLGFASTQHDPRHAIKDEMQRDVDAQMDGRQSRTMDADWWNNYLDALWASFLPQINSFWGGGSSSGRSKGVAGECGTCGYANDGDCDDGGPGSDYSLCALGSDCNDCKLKLEDVRSDDGCREYYAPYVLSRSYISLEWRYGYSTTDRCMVTRKGPGEFRWNNGVWSDCTNYWVTLPGSWSPDYPGFPGQSCRPTQRNHP